MQLHVPLASVMPGALDLKPDDFQAAFASGVVGALIASQQVIPHCLLTSNYSCICLSHAIPMLPIHAHTISITWGVKEEVVRCTGEDQRHE